MLMIEEGRGAYEKVRRGYGAGARGGPGLMLIPVGRKLNEAAACSVLVLVYSCGHLLS
jgi:hypothetical protein